MNPILVPLLTILRQLTAVQSVEGNEECKCNRTYIRWMTKPSCPSGIPISADRRVERVCIIDLGSRSTTCAVLGRCVDLSGGQYSREGTCIQQITSLSNAEKRCSMPDIGSLCSDSLGRVATPSQRSLNASLNSCATSWSAAPLEWDKEFTGTPFCACERGWARVNLATVNPTEMKGVHQRCNGLLWVRTGVG